MLQFGPLVHGIDQIMPHSDLVLSGNASFIASTSPMVTTTIKTAAKAHTCRSLPPTVKVMHRPVARAHVKPIRRSDGGRDVVLRLTRSNFEGEAFR